MLNCDCYIAILETVCKQIINSKSKYKKHFNCVQKMSAG